MIPSRRETGHAREVNPSLRLAALLGSSLLLPLTGLRADPARITFNLNFDGASLGRIEALGEDHFRLHSAGQQDEEGRNRQPTWYYFRMDGVAGHQLTLTMTDFVGEYNGKPAVAMNADLRPVYSYDGEKWQAFPESSWNDEAKEMTLPFKPEGDTLYVAHIRPYTQAHLSRLLEDLRGREGLTVETIGRSALGRDLLLLTVTNPAVPDEGKHCVWLQARQHAWEAGTSWVMDGALRFITSEAPEAKALRDKLIFKFTPMGDPDGVALGRVRFNANGYDCNRHWSEVDLRTPELLRKMPEIWYLKKALIAAHRAKPIELFVNMHNTETAEYLETQTDDEKVIAPFTRLFDKLRDETSFDPSRVPTIGAAASHGTTNDLWTEDKIPAALMELRIGTSKKLGRRPTAEDRSAFGRELVLRMAAAVLGE